MAKKIFFLSIYFLSLNFILSQNQEAEIKFYDKIINYGEIKKGSNGIRTFKFKNIGKSNLTIIKVYSSCGCTIPKKPQNPILPGDEGEIQVKYDTNRIGPIRKTITVESNSNITPTVLLKIEGSVIN